MSDDEPPSLDSASTTLLEAWFEACLEAEREAPGLAGRVVRSAPRSIRAELTDLIEVAVALQAAAPTMVPSDTYLEAARGRLMARISAESVPPQLTPWAPGRRIPSARRATKKQLATHSRLKRHSRPRNRRRRQNR